MFTQIIVFETRALPKLNCNISFSGLKNLSFSALNELYEELEVTIKDYSETLIHQLALRDELEYEKELKNQFISLLLSIQKKRRETQADKKRTVNPKRQRGAGPPEPGTVSPMLL